MFKVELIEEEVAFYLNKREAFFIAGMGQSTSNGTYGTYL